MMKTLIYVILIAFIAVSCEKDLDITKNSRKTNISIIKSKAWINDDRNNGQTVIFKFINDSILNSNLTVWDTICIDLNNLYKITEDSLKIKYFIKKENNKIIYQEWYVVYKYYVCEDSLTLTNTNGISVFYPFIDNKPL